MRILFLYISFLSTVLLFMGCKKITRDNPLDNKNPDNIYKSFLKFSRVEVTSDNNNDNVINKGESIKLKVYMKNNGNARISSLRGTISCSDNYISDLSYANNIPYYNFSTYTYDYADPGAEVCNNSLLTFNVADSIPNGSTINFSITLTDNAGNSWTDTFPITVVASGASVGFSKFEINTDNNNDKKINKGESIKLKVFLKNNGSSKANKVRGTISSSSSHIFGMSFATNAPYYLNGSSSYDYINPGQEGCASSPAYYPVFNISSDTPDGTLITFTVTITDETNNTWTDTFTLQVVATNASIGFSRYSITTDNNFNQLIDPGESIKLKVYLKNTGTSKALKVRAGISCSDPNISAIASASNISFFTNGSSSYDYIEPGIEGYPQSPGYYTGFDVSSAALPGTIIMFNLTITDESANIWTDTFTITVN